MVPKCGGTSNSQVGEGGLKPRHMAIRESGAELPAGSRGKAGGGSEGEAPLKLKAFSLLGNLLIRQICNPLGILQSQKTTYLYSANTHGTHG